MSPRSFLDTLPVEIINRILNEFCHHIRLPPCQTCLSLDYGCNPIGKPRRPDVSPSVRALASLNRTCRRLNTLTTARLYSDPTAGLHYSPMLLARTLLARPDLARLVKCLRMRSCTCCYKDAVSEEVLEYTINKVIARVRVRNLKPEPREYYETRLSETSCPTIDVLTSLCPNLEALDGENILTTDLHDTRIWSQLYKAGVQDLTHRSYEFPGDAFWTPGALSFSKLKTFHLSHVDTEMGFSLSEFQGLLGCAAFSLESLCLVQIASVDITRIPIWLNMQGTVSATAKLDNVTRLKVVHSLLNFQHLLNLVELCPNVEKFEYNCGGAIINEVGKQFGPQNVVDSAFALRGGGRGWKRLREVSLSLWADEFRDHWDEDEVSVAEKMFAERGVKFTCEI